MILINYNKFIETENHPYMPKGNDKDIVKYSNKFLADHENFLFNESVTINSINKIANDDIYVFESDLDLDTTKFVINLEVPTDSESYTPYTRNCLRSLIWSNSLAEKIFKILPQIIVSYKGSQWKSTMISSAIRYIEYREYGSQFTEHRDGYYFNEKQRTFISIVIYLNDLDSGGETEFIESGIKISPKKGNILIFPHALPHKGNPINNKKCILRGDIVFEKMKIITV